MKLLQLTLKNYQGIQSFDIRPMGSSMTISGPNGSGKSTIASSLSWLLTGKSASGEKSYSPKPLDADGHEIHHLVTSAEAVFELDNGEELIISKELSENWKKKKNGPDEFSGNTVAYYINGDPTTETMYKRTLQSYFTPDESMMLTIPSYFAEELDWTDRRRILLQISGGITDADVIAADSSLKDVPAIIAAENTDDASEALIRLQRKEKELRAEKESIIPRIDEAAVAIPDVSALDEKTLLSALEDEREKRSELSERRATLSTDTSLIENRKRIAELEAEYAEKKALYTRQMNALNAEADEAIEKAGSEIRRLKAVIHEKEDELESMERKLKGAVAKRVRLLSEYESLQKERDEVAADSSFETVCPTCHQRLPEDVIRKNEAEHRSMTERRLAEIDEAIGKTKDDGRLVKDDIEKLENSISEYRKALDDAREKLPALEKDYADAEKTIRTPLPFDTTDDAMAIAEKRDAIRRAMRDSDISRSEAEKALDDEIRASDIRSREITEKIQLFRQKEAQEKRIEELKKDAEEISENIVKTAGSIRLLQLFIRKRAEMLDDRISSMFHGVRFRLTEVLINGSIRECCEPIVKARNGWIPYTQASNAERINGGIEIIRVLSDALDKRMPVMIDNAESVIDMETPDGMQLIRLYVKDTISGGLEVA